MKQDTEALISDEEDVEIFCKSIRKNGKTIYPKNAESFHFFIRRKKNKITQE